MNRSKKVKTEGRLNRVYQDDNIVEYNIAGLSDGWHIIKYLDNNKYCLVSNNELEQIKKDADKWFSYYDIDFYKSIPTLVNAFKYDAFMGNVVKDIKENKNNEERIIEESKVKGIYDKKDVKSYILDIKDVVTKVLKDEPTFNIELPNKGNLMNDDSVITYELPVKKSTGDINEIAEEIANKLKAKLVSNRVLDVKCVVSHSKNKEFLLLSIIGPDIVSQSKKTEEKDITNKQTVEHYHLEDMGGHTMAVFGKLANGNFFAGNEELISIYDEDIWPLYHDDEDVTEFEQEHLIKTICPEEGNVSKEDLEEYYSIISQTSFFDDEDLKLFKEKLGLDNKDEVKENKPDGNYQISDFENELSAMKEFKNESKLNESKSDDMEQLANDILNWFGSDMGTWFDEIQGNEEEAYNDILFILENRDEEQIQNFIDTIEEADIDDETAKKVNIATTSSLISRLNNLLSEDNKEVKTESNDYDYIKDRRDIILALEGLKEDLLKIPNVTKVEFDTAQYANGIPGPITLVHFDIKENGSKYFDEKEILLNRILNTMEINGVNVELDELEDNDTYFYIVAYSTNWNK